MRGGSRAQTIAGPRCRRPCIGSARRQLLQDRWPLRGSWLIRHDSVPDKATAAGLPTTLLLMPMMTPLRPVLARNGLCCCNTLCVGVLPSGRRCVSCRLVTKAVAKFWTACHR